MSDNDPRSPQRTLPPAASYVHGAGGQAELAHEQRQVIPIAPIQGTTRTIDFGPSSQTIIRGFIIENYTKYAVYILYGSNPPDKATFDHRTAAYLKEGETAHTQRLALLVDTLPDGTTAPDQGNAYIRLTIDTEPIQPFSEPLITGTTTTTAAAVSVADGANTVEGATTDAAVQGDSAGTISAKLRGISKYVASVFNTVASALQVLLPGAVPKSATQTHAATVVTFAAPGAGLRYYITALSCAFGTTPAAGTTLIVADGATTILELPVPAAGPVTVPVGDGGLQQPTLNQALTATLSDGGVGIVGYVNMAARTGS